MSQTEVNQKEQTPYETLLSPFPLHKLSIRQRNPDQICTGANTLLELDGMPLKGVTFLKLEIKSAKVAKVLLEMVMNLDEIEAQIGELEVRSLGKAPRLK